MKFRNYSAKLYFFLLSLSCSIILNAQERGFNEETVKSLQENEDYHYVLPQNQQSIWDVINLWLNDFFSQFFDKDVKLDFPFLGFLFWTGIIVCIFWGLYLILKANKLFIFSNNEKVNYKNMKGIYSKKETTIPLSTQLKDAIANNDYHEIVHLYYLISIEKLDQKGIINLKKVDHHNDILFQLKSDDIKNPFNTIGTYFQYCWYGEFDANEEICLQLKPLFNELEIAINQYEKVL